LWATPTTQDATNNGGPAQRARHAAPLNLQANQHWPTPAASEMDRTEASAANRIRSGHQADMSTVVALWNSSHPAPPTCTHGKPCLPRLNPRFVAWLMNLPPGWTRLRASTNSERLAMASYLSRLQQHFESSGDGSMRPDA
jgi:hypothetical protein